MGMSSQIENKINFRFLQFFKQTKFSSISWAYSFGRNG